MRSCPTLAVRRRRRAAGERAGGRSWRAPLRLVRSWPTRTGGCAVRELLMDGKIKTASAELEAEKAINKVGVRAATMLASTWPP